jgi:hypothetical protein
MGRLLAGNAPLRGRAGLELVVPTLDYRLAAQFWDIADPRTAVLTHAVAGGTPAYRRESTQGDSPTGPDDFDDWVVRAVLNPGRGRKAPTECHFVDGLPKTPRASWCGDGQSCADQARCGLS